MAAGSVLSNRLSEIFSQHSHVGSSQTGAHILPSPEAKRSQPEPGADSEFLLLYFSSSFSLDSVSTEKLEKKSELIKYVFIFEGRQKHNKHTLILVLTGETDAHTNEVFFL